jgi:hypothetical protein
VSNSVLARVIDGNWCFDTKSHQGFFCRVAIRQGPITVCGSTFFAQRVKKNSTNRLTSVGKNHFDLQARARNHPRILINQRSNRLRCSSLIILLRNPDDRTEIPSKHTASLTFDVHPCTCTQPKEERDRSPQISGLFYFAARDEWYSDRRLLVFA